jgi:hypothetical protein
MQRVLTFVISVCALFFFLPAGVLHSDTVVPPQSLSVSLEWQDEDIEAGQELPVQIGEVGSTTIDFTISDQQLKRYLGNVATGTETFVDIYKGEYQDAELYRSYSYNYEQKPREVSVTWDEPDDYFIAIYAHPGRVLSENSEAELYAKMRPLLTEGDTSGFEADPPVLNRLMISRAYAQSVEGLLMWGKQDFDVVESGPDHSSVAFLPGFQASRLFHDTGTSLGMDRLWEPENNDDISDMVFTASGESVNEVFVGEPIDTINLFELGNLGGTVYGNFFTFLDGLKSDDIIAQISDLGGQVGIAGHGDCAQLVGQRLGLELLCDRERAGKVLPVGQDVLAVSIIHIHVFNDRYAVDQEAQFPVIIPGFKLCGRGKPDLNVFKTLFKFQLALFLSPFRLFAGLHVIRGLFPPVVQGPGLREQPVFALLFFGACGIPPFKRFELVPAICVQVLQHLRLVADVPFLRGAGLWYRSRPGRSRLRVREYQLVDGRWVTG